MKNFKEFLKEDQLEEGIFTGFVNGIIINGLLKSKLDDQAKVKIISDTIDSAIEKQGEKGIKEIKQMVKKISDKKFKEIFIKYLKNQHMIDV